MTEHAEPALLTEALAAIRSLKSRVAELERRGREPIAIVGMACRFPGGIDSVEQYWSALSAGRDLTQEVPLDRWDNDQYYDPVVGAPGKICTKRGGFVGNKDAFDAAFFRISPREAAYIDPQQRLLLETAWEALEHANIAADDLYATDAGVFVGISSFDYVGLVFGEVPEALLDHSVGTGSAHSAAAGRISYALGVHGPSVSVDTACSSSLVAVQLACESLRRGECNLALVGGVNMVLSPLSNLVFSRSHMLSPDGRCKTFDDSADGYGRSEGAGMLVLKTLTRARAEGARVLAVIRGAAVNQDGRSGGLTVPNGPAQQRLIKRALDDAGVAASDIGYVEAHGTGTPLGDPIELNALGETFQGSHQRASHPLYVGSAKTNLGHMEAAAGVGGLIKLVLQLQHGLIAPHLHLHKPSTRIAWDSLPVCVPTKATEWPRYGERRVGGVSSFGFTGTNAHVIVEEAPASVAKPASGRRRQVLCLSAKTPSALSTLSARYASWLEASPAVPWPDVCAAANVGRSHFEHRLAITAESAREAAQILTASAAEMAATPPSQRDACQIAFLFTGQGQELKGAGRALFRESKVFRDELSRCDEIVLGEVGFSIVEALYGSSHATKLNQTAYAQPLTVSLQLALTALLRSWGVTPSVVGGHSLGEYTAACAAGVLTVEHTLKLVAWRGKLMQALQEAGVMVAVDCEAARVRAALETAPGRASIAAVNAPFQTVLSGASADVAAVIAQLQGVRAKPLEVSHAFHSSLMSPMLAEYQTILGAVSFTPPQLELVSMLSGAVVGREVANPEHWLRHVLEPVEFAKGVNAMHEAGANVFIEIGAQPTLLALAARCLPSAKAAWLSTLDQRSDDWQALLSTLARLYMNGATLDWRAVTEASERQHVSLPTYPFERRRHWYVGAGRHRATRGAAAHPLLGDLVADGDSSLTLTFESVIAASSPRYLEGHRILDHVIFPVAGYVELALAAASAVGTAAGASVQELSVAAPLALQEGARLLRTSVEPVADSTYRVRITSRARTADDSVWQLHAQATLSLANQASPLAQAPRPSWLDVEKRLTTEGDVAASDRQARERGFQYGPSFCCIRKTWKGEREIRAALALDAADMDAAASYAVHPALLDAAIQLVGPLLPGAGVYLPVSIEELAYFKNPGATGFAYLRLRETADTDSALIVDMDLFDEAGVRAVALTGLRFRPVSRAALDRARRRELSRLLYTVGWQSSGETSAPRAAAAESTASSNSFRVLVADRGGLAAALASALSARGSKTCVVELDACEQPRQLRGEWLVLDPKRAEDFSWLFRELKEQGALRGTDGVAVTYLSGLDLPAPDGAQALQLAQTQLLGCGPLLNLVKALQAAGTSVSLEVVTRGALAAGDNRSLNLAQTAIAGMVTTIRSEAPQLHCRHVDLDPTLSNRTAEGEAQRLAAELLTADPQDLVAFRASQRLVARLERYPDGPALDGPVDVHLREYGSADELVLKPATRRPPTGNEVEIAVRAAGLNFKDVLHVWGVLRSFCEEQGLPWLDRRRIGFECSGTVVRTGEAVTDFKVGDEVIGLGFECLNSFVTLDARSVVPKPAVLSHEEAAGIPTAYLTAVYGLVRLAQLHPGDTVLVHAAAGGVGQAALRVCAEVGADVLATASSGKWDFLRAQGVREPMSSRTLDFEEAIRERTGGRGVDVVLNSLGGEFIPASLNCLARGGRFVEIGKRGIWSSEQVARLRPDVQYFAFDLGDIDATVAQGLPGLLREICLSIEAGRLAALPVQPFPVDRVQEALRTLAESKNVGKVVVHFPPSELPPSSPLVRDDRTYLITGGLGGLGLATAAWLQQKGARHLALLGRNAASEQTEVALQALRDAGTAVRTFAADISGPTASIREAIQKIGQAMPPLAGVVHAAGVTEDVLMSDMSWEQLERVLLPKTLGAWNLHSLTQEHRLDFFVAYSSATATIGSLGQANYTAANAFLDALCMARSAQGLPGLSVGWGPWADIGMAERLPEALQRNIEARGLAFLEPARNFELLELLLKDRVDRAIAANVDWNKYLSRIALGGSTQLFARLQAEQPQDPSQVDAEVMAMKTRLEQCPPHERRAVLMDYLRSVLTRVLRFGPGEAIDARRGLFDLGLDSLAVVEVKSRIEQGVGHSISATVMLDFPTLEQLTDHLHDELFGADAASGVGERGLESRQS